MVVIGDSLVIGGDIVGGIRHAISHALNLLGNHITSQSCHEKGNKTHDCQTKTYEGHSPIDAILSTRYRVLYRSVRRYIIRILKTLVQTGRDDTETTAN